MIPTEHPDIREALAIEVAQNELDMRKKLSQTALRKRLDKARKPCVRILIDNKIVTVSANTHGNCVQIHVSDLDSVDKPPRGYDIK